jgi:Raf kinase inhibitor-like YbhB/YbcL family protein
MLQLLPRAIGPSLRPTRGGRGRIVLSELDADPRKGSIDVFSTAFSDGEHIPRRYTADGAGVSPSIRWRGVPGGAASLVLVIEDMDSATVHPVVHAIVWGLAGSDGGVPEGALSNARARLRGPPLGRNSDNRTRYRPPKPPRGHGPHRYAFEVIALDAAPSFAKAPTRVEIIEVARGHVVGAGCLVGTYGRGR